MITLGLRTNATGLGPVSGLSVRNTNPPSLDGGLLSYVTTGSLSQDQLKVISDEVGKDRSLVICCKAFMADTEQFPNLTLRKIPQAILHKCEWDHDDYSFSLNVLPDEDEEHDEIELGEDESEEVAASERQSTALSEE